MHVVMLSKACIVGTYQRKLEELASLPGIRLTLLTPPSWHDSRGKQALERVFTRGYTLRVTPLALNGHFHWHFYPRLAAELAELQPDLLHVDEEPYNLATRLALGTAHRQGTPACFFTWQNIQRRYPPPFAGWERYAYRHVAHAIAGNHAAGRVLRAKGFRGPISVIPQFGVDPELFAPAVGGMAAPSSRPLTIGYAGGLLAEKGLDTLLAACASLHGDWRLRLVGSGDQQSALSRLADRLGISSQVTFAQKLPSTAMPGFYQSIDVLVLPSRTQANWMEQFGRVSIEAMACATPVIGSSSGEIPHVIGDAGLIFPEGDAAALAAHLQRCAADPGFRQRLGEMGRTRVLAQYTQRQIAQATAQVYATMMGATNSG